MSVDIQIKSQWKWKHAIKKTELKPTIDMELYSGGLVGCRNSSRGVETYRYLIYSSQLFRAMISVLHLLYVRIFRWFVGLAHAVFCAFSLTLMVPYMWFLILWLVRTSFVVSLLFLYLLLESFVCALIEQLLAIIRVQFTSHFCYLWPYAVEMPLLFLLVFLDTLPSLDFAGEWELLVALH